MPNIAVHGIEDLRKRRARVDDFVRPVKVRSPYPVGIRLASILRTIAIAYVVSISARVADVPVAWLVLVLNARP